MLNKKLLSYKTKSIIKKSQVPRGSMAYNNAETIGLIFSIDDLHKHESIKRFIDRLSADNKKVEVLSYLPKKKENHEFLFDFFTVKDINFWGTFTSEKVEKFAKKPFDYLFYLDVESNPLIRNILAMSKAKCRVGRFSEENEPFCEMMIQTTDNSIDSLINEMYKYTKILS
ncbi:hypothetical protein E1176_05995 [Fulvivirga sp. RKSG066]|uniref:DUF6913 domain-containing protein n=1 Tax=Fulvivirga aurantia TaxID=2529383 RepID=UPI0012BC3333|nr:hypothetical protein [Fulvivirga aurantia]MTI20565.1 hypothetical protein [Fulvivirga aurantia]